MRAQLGAQENAERLGAYSGRNLPLIPAETGHPSGNPVSSGRFAPESVAVELDAVNRIFTTLPVVPVPERMSQE